MFFASFCSAGEGARDSVSSQAVLTAQAIACLHVFVEPRRERLRLLLHEVAIDQRERLQRDACSRAAPGRT